MPLNIDFQQIFLHLLNFTLLFAALYFLLYKPVKAFMAKRDEYYAGLDRQAKEKLEEAERIHQSYCQQLAQAGEEIQAQADEAQRQAMASAEQQLQKAQAEAAHVLAKARAEAKTEKDRIVQEAHTEVREMISAAAEKLLLANTSAAYDQFLDAAGKEEQDA